MAGNGLKSVTFDTKSLSYYLIELHQVSSFVSFLLRVVFYYYYFYFCFKKLAQYAFKRLKQQFLVKDYSYELTRLMT